MSEAEAAYTRRLTAAKLHGRSIEEVENSQNRNVLKEVKKRIQVCSTGARESQCTCVDEYTPPSQRVLTQNANSVGPLSACLQSISEAQAMISKSRSRITIAEQELSEIRRRDSNERALKHKVDGLPYTARIREAHRYDWTRRYAAAMSADEESEEALEVAYFSRFYSTTFLF